MLQRFFFYHEYVKEQQHCFSQGFQKLYKLVGVIISKNFTMNSFQVFLDFTDTKMAFSGDDVLGKVLILFVIRGKYLTCCTKKLVKRIRKVISTTKLILEAEEYFTVARPKSLTKFAFKKLL